MYNTPMHEFIYSRNAVYETLRAGRRRAYRLLLAEGVRPKRQLAAALKLAEAARIPVQRVPRSRLDAIHPGHQGVALEADEYPYSDLPAILAHARASGEAPFLLLLDTLQDPQNLGTVIRTAEAVGVHGLLIPSARSAQVTPAVVNASSGASEHLLIARLNLHQAIARLKEADLWIVGLDQGGQPLQSTAPAFFRGGLGLVVGSEGRGMRPLTAKSCDVVVRLPMRGKIESLNAAVAGSVALYLAYLSRLSKDQG